MLAVVAPTGVRKTVTVVFCDLVGSTALGERSDPEVLREVMGRYHAELRACLERHGGTVEKFVGDAAMAVFGLPQVHEDDALRAVRAAVEMRAAVVPLHLEVRIGVNSGEVVAGGGETLVTGDAVNVAARLEQAAQPGEVLIGEATERLVRGAVRSERIEPLALKGKTLPVPAFRVLELQRELPAFTQPSGGPFVGRSGELEQLEGALAEAFDTRSPRLVTIVGPPGIGKSRLVRELLAGTQARVLVGRCLSYGDGITYWPLAEIADQLGEIESLLRDEPMARVRVEAALGSTELVASPEEIAWGFRRLFEALARERPLIVVFDDIHWAEPTLLDLIEYTATFAQDAPLLLLCTARADLFEMRPEWSAPRANSTLITLDALPRAAAESLVEQLGHLAPATRARIADAAEGNPLFVEQLVAMQAESGEIEIEIPPTLHALLAARIDRLDRGERAVVECGSVEGRLFHRGAVAELLPAATRAQLGTHLRTLVRKELLRPDRGTIRGDDGFRFGHLLIRDAAYETIPKRQRADLHERYADWLSAMLAEDAPAEVVGYHLEQAHRYRTELGAPDPALGERAAARLATAARAARGRLDVGAATKLLTRAVALVPSPAEARRGLLVELGEVLYQAAELTRTEDVLTEAVGLARSAGDAHSEWLARVQLGFLRLRRQPEGAAETALLEAQAAIEALSDAADHEVLGRAWHLIGEVHLMHARAQEQTQALDQALGHARQAGDSMLELSIILQSAAPIVMGPVPVEQGMRHVERLLADKGEVPAIHSLGLHVLGHLHARLGQFDGAQQALAEWRGHFRELGQELQFAITAGCVWDVLSLAEDWGGGERALTEGYEILERMGEKSFLSTCAAYLGEAVFRQGRLAEAERYSVVSEELGASDDHANEATWRAVRAKVLAARGDLASAVPLARSAVEAAGHTDFLDLRARTWLDLADILAAAAERTAAEGAAREGLALYEQKGNLVGIAHGKKLLDRLS